MSKDHFAGILALISIFVPTSAKSAGPASGPSVQITNPAARPGTPAAQAPAAVENPAAVTFPGFERYVDLKGFYSVLMRGTPKSGAFELNGAKYLSASVDDKDGTYSVAFADMQDLGNPPYDAKKVNVIVNEQPKAFIDRIHGKMQVYRAHGKFGYQFREVEGRLDSGLRQGGRFRINCYLAGKRMFIVSAEGKEDWVKSAQSNAFLSSFEVPGATAVPKLNIK